MAPGEKATNKRSINQVYAGEAAKNVTATGLMAKDDTNTNKTKTHKIAPQKVAKGQVSPSKLKILHIRVSLCQTLPSITALQDFATAALMFAGISRQNFYVFDKEAIVHWLQRDVNGEAVMRVHTQRWNVNYTDTEGIKERGLLIRIFKDAPYENCISRFRGEMEIEAYNDRSQFGFLICPQCSRLYVNPKKTLGTLPPMMHSEFAYSYPDQEYAKQKLVRLVESMKDVKELMEVGTFFEE